MALSGKFIVIEGLEGAGKSTVLQTVTKLLEEHKISCITVREPGGTEIGEILRSIIKNPAYRDLLEDKTELLLLYASRIQLLEQIIKPALKRGDWVLADRFELSTRAYQGGGRGLDQRMIDQLSSFCLQGFKPDLTIYLDISPELGMQRAGLRGNFDRIEQQPMDFFHRVQKSYVEALQNTQHSVRIDASLAWEEVQAQIKKTIGHYISIAKKYE